MREQGGVESGARAGAVADARRGAGGSGSVNRQVPNGAALLARNVAGEYSAFESEECPICLVDWEDVSCCVIIPACGHPVCRDCLLDWSDQLQRQRGSRAGEDSRAAGGEVGGSSVRTRSVCTLCKAVVETDCNTWGT